jgi:D-glycero-alpha-D-manno-heptose-7-phosphate kinase
MIISRTPLRISFFGGGTDYPQYYNIHGGAILGTTIDKFCYVMLHNGKSWYTFDLPNKSGLASSSAYTVGLLRVCTELDNLTLSRLATTWEQDKTGGMVGSQDQYLCAMGGFHHLKFSEHGIKDIPLVSEWVTPLQDYLMLFDTNQYRRNGDIIPSQLERIKENETILTRMGEIVEEGIESLKQQDYISFGKLLDETWWLKRRLSDKVSTPLIDQIYDTAINAGVMGGKLLGGGGGGFILFMVEPDKQEKVRQALNGLDYVKFNFENDGTKVIYRDD